MKLTIHTERGSYTSKTADLTEEQAEQLQGLIEQSAERGNYFKLDTGEGYVVLGKGLLQTAAFVVEAVEGADRSSRCMFVARLENMQKNGDHWLTVTAALALLNDCDMLASKA